MLRALPFSVLLPTGVFLDVEVSEEEDEGGVVPRGELHHPEGEVARLAVPDQRVEVVEHVEEELRDLKGDREWRVCIASSRQRRLMPNMNHMGHS